MKDLTPIEIGDKIKRLSGIDLYKNTRKRDFVEHRALLCYILRDKLQMRWTFIASFFISQGKHMDHANCMHLVKMYPIYRQGNKTLETIEKTFVFNSKIPLDEIDKVNYLENKYESLESEYLKQKEQLKNPLVKLVIDIPNDKLVDAKDRIKLMKASWKWLNK